MAFALRILIALVLLAVAGGPGGSVQAQTVDSPKAAAKEKAAAEAAKKKKATEDAQRAYAAGTRAYESGKADQAVQQLTAALRGGGLPPAQMARALYLRGLAYRKQGKPGLAISDLTSAVWLKNGLSGKDRADAIAKRSEAYREAGLKEPEAPGHVVAGADSAKPAAETKTTSSGSGGGLLPWLTGGSSSPAPAEAPKAAAAPKAAPAATPDWETATLSSAVSRPTTSGAPKTASDLTSPMPQAGPPAAAAPSQAPASEPAPGNNLFSAIGSIFSGSSSSNTTTPETTASTGHVAAVSSWSDSTQVTPAGPASAAANARTAAASGASASTSAPQFSGKYRLQVAAVRSREEARELANKLQAEHGPSLQGRTPSVDEAVIGAMGTFYRVRVGPFADAGQPRKLCPALKADGFDCLIISK